jgi:D-beta-D-heptose 7-phosphate kinase/D-beta-D-heptose 1-phosphate adenosyltransferase
MTAIDSLKAGQESKILLIGDLLIDKTITVEVKKISPEAPVPVANLLPGNNTRESPGGAGFAASYAIKDNIPILFLTACSYKRAAWLREMNIPTGFYRTTDNIHKIRYVDRASGYHLIRIDTDHTVKPPDLDTKDRVETFKLLFTDVLKTESITIVALLDYRKGILSNPFLTQWIIQKCKSKGILIYTDSRSKDLRKFEGTTILKLNSAEFELACGALNVSSARELISKLKIETLLITKGKDGAEAHTLEVRFSSIAYPTDPAGNPDVTGCGDVFDMSFCYHWGVLNRSIDYALELSVDRATQFAYEPIGERTLC